MVGQEFDAQGAIESLRREGLTERLEIQHTISAGFDSLAKKLDGYFEAQNDIDTRLVKVEGSVRLYNRFMGGGFATLFTAFIGWLAARWR